AQCKGRSIANGVRPDPFSSYPLRDRLAGSRPRRAGDVSPLRTFSFSQGANAPRSPESRQATHGDGAQPGRGPDVSQPGRRGSNSLEWLDRAMKYGRGLLADSHLNMLGGIHSLLDALFEAVLMVADERSLEDAVRTFQPDLVVVDLSLSGAGEANIARRL